MPDTKPKAKPTDKAYEVALYQDMDSGYIQINHYYGDEDAKSHLSCYVRVSEPATIRFRPLATDTVVANALETLKAKENEARLKLAEELKRIANLRSSLLALTYTPSESDAAPETVPTPPPCVSDHGATAAPF